MRFFGQFLRFEHQFQAFELCYTRRQNKRGPWLKSKLKLTERKKMIECKLTLSFKCQHLKFLFNEIDEVLKFKPARKGLNYGVKTT